jgi:hypothetical protein
MYFSNFGMPSFLFQTRVRHSMWFNGTIMDCKLKISPNKPVHAKDFREMLCWLKITHYDETFSRYKTLTILMVLIL